MGPGISSSPRSTGDTLKSCRKSPIPGQVFTTPFTVPKTDGSGGNRENLRRAAELLAEAGWKAVGGKLTKDGQRFGFEFLLASPLFERVVLPYAKNLEKLGIEASVRTVDSAQYRRRSDTFDFDVIVGVWPQSESPGNEQRDFWGSEAASREGSRNLLGLADPVVDELVEGLVAAPDRESLISYARALDRVLLWGHYVVPNWHISSDRIAYWNQFGRPDVVPRQGVQIGAWWWDPDRAARLEGGGKAR